VLYYKLPKYLKGSR